MLALAYLLAIVAPLVLLVVAIATNKAEQTRDGITITTRGHAPVAAPAAPEPAMALAAAPSVNRMARPVLPAAAQPRPVQAATTFAPTFAGSSARAQVLTVSAQSRI